LNLTHLITVHSTIHSIYKGAIVSRESYPTDISKSALELWKDELSTQAEVTAKLYEPYFIEFCKFIGETPDQILEQRIQDDLSQDRKTKRRYETFFRLFLKHKKKTPIPRTGKPPAPTTLQTIYASVRSFFELHEYPLKMRRKDYPKGKALGVRRATKSHIQKVLNKYPNNTRLRTLIHTINDTGLGASDVCALNCRIFLEKPNAKIIMYKTLRIKTKDEITTFFAEESLTAIRKYLEHRKNGTRKLTPETITPETPLFVQYENGEPTRLKRSNLSTTIQTAFLNTEEKHLSAHSIRKKLQTCLEKGNMPTNWIDQVLGHELINSRDAYSKPTDEELQEKYEQAYNQVRIQPQQTTTTTENLDEYAEAKTLNECKQLLAKGYKFEMDYEGTKLFSRKRD
jgi:site-specific recombinase XerD